MGLSERDEKFCRIYIANNFNAVEAYQATHENANIETCRSNGYRTLKRPAIKARIDELLKEAYEAACLTPERLALKLRDMCFAAKDDEYYTPNIQLKALDLLQKQLGVQKQQIKAEVDNAVTINVGIEE